jgi:ferredoxin--NADP+ reductase
MYKERVTWVHHWGDKTFSFRTTRNQAFRFNAGEFAMIGLEAEGKKILRAYSVASAPWEEHTEWLSVKVQDGELTSRLQHLKVGDEVVMMPKCTGTLRNEALKPGGTLWMLATGTGLAPFMSLIRDIDTLEQWDKINIVHSVRERHELAYYEQLNTNFADNPDIYEMVARVLTYRPIVTGEGEERITDKLWRERLPVKAQDKVMICGNMRFNEDMIKWCEHMGMKEGTLKNPGEYVIERAFIDS